MTLLVPRASGHVGQKLRLGYRPEPVLSALAHLTETYLEEVSPYQVDLKVFDDPTSLKKALGEGEADLAVEYPAVAWARAACQPQGTSTEEVFDLMRSYCRENFGAAWAGMFDLRREGLPCYAPFYVITGTIAGSLSYYTLPDYLQKLLKAVDHQGLAEILRKDPTGRKREVMQDFLVRKGLV